MQLSQQIRDDGPESHQKKAGTPTMGGSLIILALAAATLLWCDLRNQFVWLTLVVTVGFGVIGFLDDYLSVKGAAFSFEPVLTQSAYFRPHNQSEDVAGLYLVGAGTHPGAGMPGVLSSARVLDTVVPDPADLRRKTA